MYPAWFDVHQDTEVAKRPTALRVYAYLLRDPRALFHPVPFKVEIVAAQLRTHRDRITEAVELLLSRGYVLDHGRGSNNVRRLTIALVRELPTK